MSLLLKKNGDLIREDHPKSYKVGDFLPYLGDVLEIEKGATFETFFNIIMANHKEYSKVFASQLGHYKLKDFNEEWKKPAEQKEKGDKMTSVCVYWHPVELWKKSIENTHSMMSGFDGQNARFKYGLDFVPLHKLKIFPMKLDTKLEIIDPQKHFEAVFSTNIWLTVYDVISAVLYEITFYGVPKQRDKKCKELLDRVEESKEYMKKTKGKKVD